MTTRTTQNAGTAQDAGTPAAGTPAKRSGGWGSALYRRGRYFSLALLMIAALGLAALQTIGRQEDPTITNLFATVLTPFPGASPERVEALVTETIEAELREIPEIDELRSTSATGISSVQIELSQFLPDTELERVWSEIRDALSDAARALPDGAFEPEFDNDRTGAFTAIYSLKAAQGSAAELEIASRYAEALQDRLRQTPGTKLVSLYGAREEEVLVRVDGDALAASGLTVREVAAAIARADAKVEAGRVRGQGTDYLIEVAGEITSLDRVRDVPLATADGGALLRLGDVAEVLRASRTPAETSALAGGDPAVLIAARMEDDLQVDTWMRGVRAEVDAFSVDLPAGLALTQLFDQSEYTSERLSEVAVNLAIGVSIVVAVLFLSMGFWAALVVGVMLPLTTLATFAILEKIGIVIHQMSVTGLIVALGLLVDAAIVMTDEIRRRLAAGVARLQAVEGAVSRLAIPLLASTVTTVLAFVPMATLPGPAGDFVGAIAISVIVMLIMSLVLALTVTPALAGRLLPNPAATTDGRPPRRRWLRDGIGGGPIAAGFRALLTLSLRERGVSIIAALMLPVVGFMAFPTLKAQFFPGVDRNQFHIQATLAEGSALAKTAVTAAKLDAVIRAEPEVRDVQWVKGASAPAFYYNITADRDNQPNYAQALVTTTSPEATEAMLARLQTALDAAAPEAQVVVRGLVQGPPVNAPVELRLVGPSLEVLRLFGEQARARLAATPAVTHTTADLVGGAPKLVFELDEEKVRLAGLQLADVAAQLDAALEGVVGGSLVEGSEQLPVRVRLGAEERSAADRVLDLQIMPPGAASTAEAGVYPGLPLLALGDLQLTPSESPIARKDGERVNTVRAFLERDILPEEVLAALQADLAERPLDLPPGYRIEWGGDSDARNETVANLISVLAPVVVLSIATIVLTFNSWRLSLVAFTVTILSAGLSMLSLAVMQYPFGITALIGVIGSIGVSINAAIIIMTALQEDPRAAAGDKDAIRDVVLGSSRHIVSTTVTTFGGFLPLILAGGGFWPPFAMAIAGGVLLSTAISFFFVPQCFSLLAGRGKTPEAQAGPALAAV